MNTLRMLSCGLRVQQVGWLSDGQRLAVLGWAEGSNRPEVGVVSLDGRYKQLFVGVYGGIHTSPVEPVVAMTTGDELVVHGPEMSAPRTRKLQSLAGCQGAQDIAWSPNGKLLALKANRSSNPSTVVSDVEMLVVLDQDLTLVTQLEASNSFASVSWDRQSDQLIYWWGDNRGLTIRTAEGDPIRQIVEGSKGVYNPKYDTLVYLERREPVYCLMVEQNGTSRVIGSFHFRNKLYYPPDTLLWSPDGNKLLFDGIEHYGLLRSRRAWMVYDLKSAKLSPLMKNEPKEPRLRFPAWSPDSKQIAFAQSDGVLLYDL